MSDLARRLAAAEELPALAGRLAAADPYDVAQTSTARDLERLADALRRAADRADRRSS